MPTDRTTASDPHLVWVGLAVLYTVWGSTYLAIAVAVDTIPPFLMAALRFGLAGLLLLTWVALRDRAALRRPTRREVIDTSIVGALLLGGGMGMVAWAEQTIPSGIAALLVAMMPVWVAVYGRAFLRERLPRLAVAGIGIGIVGVAVLVGRSVTIEGSLDPAGILALIISPMAWAAGATFSAHRARLPDDPFLATGLEMLSGSIVLALAALVTGEVASFRPSDVSTDSLLATVYLTAVGSLVAFTAFAWVIRHAPLPLVATYAFVNPIIAVVLGSLLLHESVGPIQLVAGGVIIVGVALIILARSRMSADPVPVTSDREDVRAAA